MKKKLMLITLICTFVIGIGIIVGTKFVNAEENEKVIVYNSQKSVHDKVDDGWVNVFEIYYDKAGEINNYLFDGYNLKYKELDGYYVPVLDVDGNEIYRVTPNYITLSISEKYKSDIRKINTFFNEKQFTSEITINDLRDLDIVNIKKEYLVELFNKTIKSELKTNKGNYYNSSFINKVEVPSSDESMNGTWQISYLLDFGYISDVNIEFISSDGKYMSDLENSNINIEKIKMYDNIKKVENSIIETQSFEVDNKNENIFSTFNSKETNAINNDMNSLLKLANESLSE